MEDSEKTERQRKAFTKENFTDVGKIIVKNRQVMYRQIKETIGLSLLKIFSVLDIICMGQNFVVTGCNKV